MNSYQVKTFVCVVEQGSFSRASEILFTSKQALIKQIQALEEELGIKLFSRSNRGIVPTAAGRRFLEGVIKIGTEFKYLVQDCRNIDKNNRVIKIASLEHHQLFLEKAMAEFSSRFPEVKQEIYYFKVFEDPIRGLLNNSYDIVACFLKDEYLREGISYTYMFHQPCLCIMAESNPLANQKFVTLKDISRHRIGMSKRKYKLDIIAELEAINPDVNIVECDGDESQFILNFCFTGGIYISKIYFVANLKPLVPVPLKPDFAEQIVVYYRKDHPDALTDFINVIAEVYGQAANPRLGL
jgi:DNA-binding transcriptional LysR family regulator